MALSRGRFAAQYRVAFGFLAFAVDGEAPPAAGQSDAAEVAAGLFPGSLGAAERLFEGNAVVCYDHVHKYMPDMGKRAAQAETEKVNCLKRLIFAL